MKLSGFQNIVLDHCSRYPELQVEDLYKLAHQAALGSEHAIKDIESARQWLVRELAQLPDSSAEPLIDTISPDQSIVRVHLVPYIESGGESENLLQAFIRTANDFHGRIDLLKDYWRDVEALAQRGEIRFSFESLKFFIDRTERLNFPAVHHSTQYNEAYHPHYRVIAQEFLWIGTGDLDLSS